MPVGRSSCDEYSAGSVAIRYACTASSVASQPNSPASSRIARRYVRPGLAAGKVLNPLRRFLRKTVAGVRADVMDGEDQGIAAEQGQREVKPKMRALIVNYVRAEFVDGLPLCAAADAISHPDVALEVNVQAVREHKHASAKRLQQLA